MLALADHLWQSTLFAGAVLALTILFRKNRAQTRYALWLAASLKLLIPFALLVTAGRQLEWRTAPPAAPIVSGAVEQVTQPFTAVVLPVAAPAASAGVPG